MPTYYSYYSSVGRDRFTKHVVQHGRIDTYERGMFFPFLLKWELKMSFEIGGDTKILEEKIGDNGNGWIELDNNREKYTFFVFQFAAEFIAEVKHNGFP